MMDSFMDKLAEKVSASDIIRANAQAEAAETERLRQEAEQFRTQLEQLKESEKEHRAIIEETRDSLNSRMDDNESKIHDVGVQVYRNVQAIVEKSREKSEEGFKELDNRLETLQYAVESKNKAVTPLVVITLLIALSDLVFNILRFLGVI
ncbi:hypothetical protein [Butyrivibrio sp. FCS014]|uniref:hypothetical protein n=1 Tax=Butyrivibrio sp. FCS014 TaxID=1408304 RepID=UPI0004BA18EB|nr:hypothetical protein [Butyrivibrio sp. FCS014]